MRRAGFAVVAVAVAGCALVIDLGDKVRPFPEAGTIVPDTGPANPIVDAAVEAQAQTDADAGPAGPRCGLAESPNEACAECYVKTECCDVNRTCARDPDCVAGLECIKDCVVNSACIDQCKIDHPGIAPVTDCTIANCFLCTPPSQCVRLGQCIFNLPKTSIVRQTYRNAILELDAQKCTEIRKQVAANGESDAGQCFD